MIAILDYGSGNIRSAQRALERAGLTTSVTSDFDSALAADGLVVPGVGAFGSCMQQLRAIRGDELIRQRVEESKAILGICVGMQVLFEGSAEDSDEGLSVVNGRVERIENKVLPHIGWNTVESKSESQLFKGLRDERFYFVHSFAAKVAPAGSITAMSEYGETFLAAIELGAISAVQFHPEKSGAAGIQLLRNWAEQI